MSYPGVQEQDVPEAFRPTSEQPIPAAPTIVQPTVAAAPPSYGGAAWAPPRQYDFRTPSGALCRLQKLDQEAALSLGLLNHLDIFSPKLLQGADGKARKPEDIEEEVVSKLAKDGKSEDFFETVKKIVLAGVIAPKLHDVPKAFPLPDGEFSVNNITFTDKMAIFHSVFGEDMQKIESFREGQAGGVGAVQPSTVVQHDAEPPTGNT